jgi:hypothetical protein
MPSPRRHASAPRTTTRARAPGIGLVRDWPQLRSLFLFYVVYTVSAAGPGMCTKLTTPKPAIARELGDPSVQVAGARSSAALDDLAFSFLLFGGTSG